ncbi:MAG: sodium:solute symporter family protein [Candidatus Thermoplasmatota archaeon]|nr:sodium:solute symporter family protein [Candidatus Thermoplasmatota archaeon]
MADPVFAILLISYLLVLLFIGYRSRTKSGDAHFFIADRKLDRRSVAFTLGATVVGGSAVIVTGSLVFEHGTSGLWYDIGGILGLIFLGIFVAPRIRRTRAHSLPDLIGIHYGETGKVASSLVLVLVEIGWIALLLQASRYVLSEAAGISPEIALPLAAAVFIAYTIMGGQRAVVMTDKVQIVLSILALILIFFGMASRGGGIDPSSLSFPVSKGIGPTLAISAFLIMFLSHAVGPDIYSKVFSSRSGTEARWGVIGGGLLKLFASVLVASIALLGISMYGDSISGGALIPTAAKDVLPGALFYVAMIGLLSVMLSSADSCLLSGATFISWDLLKAKDGRWTRSISIAVLGIVSYIVAFHSPGILETLTLTYTFFSASMVPSVIAIPWKDRLGIDRKGAISSFIVGGGGVLLLYILTTMEIWSGSLLFLPLTLSFLILFAVSRIPTGNHGIGNSI